MRKTKEVLIKQITECYKSPLNSYLISLIKPAISLVKKDTEKNGHLISKIGGIPKIGKIENWPRSQRNNKPLLFLLQLNLKELVEFDIEDVLPPSGMLSFFFDVDNWSDGLVKYYEEGEELKEAPLPEEFKKEEERKKLPFWKRIFTRSSGLQIYKEFNLGGEIEYQIPSYSSVYIELFEKESSTRHYTYVIDDHKVERYFLSDDWDEQHHLFGYYNALQESQYEVFDPKKDWRLMKANTIKDLKEAQEWIILLKLGSDSKTNMMWVDAGNLFFFIRKRDLEKGDFQKVKVCLDTT